MGINFGKTLAIKLLLPAIIIIAVGAWATLAKIKSDVRLEAGQSLITIVKTTQQAVHTWFGENQSDALFWANTKEVRDLSWALLNGSQKKETLLTSPLQVKLRARLSPVIISKGYRGFFIVGPGNTNLSSSRDENIGIVNLVATQQEFFNKIWAGQTAISLPQFSDVPLLDVSGNMVDALPTMFVGAPIKGSSGQIISVLLFRLDPSADFTAIFQRARMGQSGETYAFDRKGRLISESRFDDHLRQIDLIPAGKRGILNVSIRDPEVNLVRGERSNVPRDQHPLTLMAKSATAGESGMNLEGYRDYRGVPVIGAWVWDKKSGFGITSEIDVEEVNKFQKTTRIVFLLYVALTIATLILLAVVFENGRRKLFRAKNEAEAANKTKSTFLSAMSHELRTPMNAILGFGELLTSNTSEPLSTNQTEYANHILAGGRNLQTLIDNILSFTEITDKNVSMNPEDVDAGEMINSCIEHYRNDAKILGIKLITNITDVGLPRLYIDPKSGIEIIKAFLSNAVLYNYEGGTVKVTVLRIEGNLLRIIVTDTGKGIPTEFRDKVFIPFERLDMENSSIGGAGVGLAIAKMLADLMGARVGFESEESRGSAFWVDFPVDPSRSNQE